MSSRKKMSMGSRKRVPKVRDFVKTCIEKGILSPSKMRDIYNEKYPSKVKGVSKPKTADAFRKAIRRSGISAEKRLELKHEAQKSKELKDIEEYEEVQSYLSFSSLSKIGKHQINATLKNIRTLWNWMVTEGYPNPREWNMNNLVKCLEKNVGQREDGQWTSNDKVLRILGAFNRCFQGRLPKGWSMGLKRPAGELKDFFEYEEFEEFCKQLMDTGEMSREGWDAEYSCQVNAGCREGSAKTKTGIWSLRWENINYNTRRCKIRDKGKKGHPARLWTQIPLDLFPWLNGWEKLVKWHEQHYGYKPTQSNHATGRCFPVSYDQYRRQFHNTRHRCNSRIKQDLETMRPHIFRKTHAQYCKRIGVNLEHICGDTTSDVCEGRYGVGWTKPEIALKFYLTKEEWEYAEQDQKIKERLKDRVFPQLESAGLFSSLCIPIAQVPSTRKVSARSRARKNRSNCDVRPSFSLAVEQASNSFRSRIKSLSENIHSQNNIRTNSAK